MYAVFTICRKIEKVVKECSSVEFAGDRHSYSLRMGGVLWEKQRTDGHLSVGACMTYLI